LREEGTVSDGDGDEDPSFFQEYQWKLRKVYDTFYTERARHLAEGRREAAVAFYRSMVAEVTDTHRAGMKKLAGLLE
jgi:uncharacterized protein